MRNILISIALGAVFASATQAQEQVKATSVTQEGVIFRVDRSKWNKLNKKQQEKVLAFLTKKVGVLKEGESVTLADDVAERRSTKLHDRVRAARVTVDDCDNVAQIIYDGMSASSGYSDEEAADHAADFFDECCTTLVDRNSNN